MITLQVETDTLQTLAKLHVLWELTELEMRAVDNHQSVVSISLAGTASRTILTGFNPTVEVSIGNVL